MARHVFRIALRIAQELEPFPGVRVGCGVEWVVIDAGRGTGNFPIVGCGVEVQDAEVMLEEGDAGEERFALDAVFVEVGWVSVGGCDEDGAVGH